MSSLFFSKNVLYLLTWLPPPRNNPKMILLDFFHHHNKFVYKLDQMFSSNYRIRTLGCVHSTPQTSGEKGICCCSCSRFKFPHGFLGTLLFLFLLSLR